MFGSDPYLITTGDNVHIAKGVSFITHDGGTLILRKEVPGLELTAPISIGNDVYVGVNAIILAGVSIGNRCIIGAGARRDQEYCRQQRSSGSSGPGRENRRSIP
jgi:acetyltransferase-like isoleucine patch superfamily enzyme